MPRDETELVALMDVCTEYLEFIEGDDYNEDSDYEDYIFEAALRYIFGKDVFEERIYSALEMQEERSQEARLQYLIAQRDKEIAQLRKAQERKKE